MEFERIATLGNHGRRHVVACGVDLRSRSIAMMDLRDPCRRCAPKAYAVLADIPWAAAPDIPTVDAAARTVGLDTTPIDVTGPL
jgi:hypothetical protein